MSVYVGWITRNDILSAFAGQVHATAGDIERGAIAADVGAADPQAEAHAPSTPLPGYQLLEVTIPQRSPAIGHRLADANWPAGTIPLAIEDDGELVAPARSASIAAGSRIVLLAPETAPDAPP